MWISAELFSHFLARMVIKLWCQFINKLCFLFLFDIQALYLVIHIIHNRCKDNKFISFLI